MAINSRQKGANFELEVADILSKWWGGKIRRVPLSGGHSKMSSSGDILPVDENRHLWPFSVECKKTAGWDFSDLLKIPKADQDTLIAFWRQCTEDCDVYNHNNTKRPRIPILIFSANFQPVYAMLNLEDFEKICSTLPDEAFLTWTYKDNTNVVLKLEHLLGVVGAAQFKEM